MASIAYLQKGEGIGQPIKFAEKARTPKGQDGKNRQGIETFQRVPITTLDSIVELLSDTYGERSFSFADGLKVAMNHGIRRSTFGYALRYGISQGVLKRSARGTYTFGAVASRPVADTDNLIELAAESCDKLLPIIRSISRVTDNVHLYLNADGVFARFSNESKNAMFDVKIGKSVFSVYHVKSGHVRISLSSRELEKVLSANKERPFHLTLPKETAAFYSICGHMLQVLSCEVSPTAFEIEQPLMDAKHDCDFEVDRSYLVETLTNIGVHSDIMRLSCSAGVLTFDSPESDSFRRIMLIEGGKDVSACFEFKGIVGLIGSRFLKGDKVILGLSKEVLVVKLLNDGDCRLDYYVVPCKVEEIEKV